MFVREQNPSAGMANVATYLVGPRGPEYRRDDSSGAIRWYCYDGLGSVLGEVNTTGTLTATRSYDVYGSVRTNAGTSTSKHKFCGQLGHPSEDETGLIYMRARYMDPVTGRFVSQDPGRQGENWLLYCNNNPINATDDTGQRWKMPNGVRFLAWVAAVALFAYAIEQLYYSSVSSAITMKNAVEALEGAAVLFGLAAVGLSDSQSLVLWIISAAEFAATAHVFEGMAASTAAGLKTQAAPAVTALAFQAMVELGIILSIGADT